MPASQASPLALATPVPRRRLWTALALTLLLAPRLATADDKAPPASTGNKTGNQTGNKTGSSSGSASGGNSVADGFRSLGQQISDPRTLDRIKGHEQEFEKNVQGTRDQQRKSHPGELRATDATDMANDPKMGGQGKTRGGSKSTTTTTTTTRSAPAKTAVKPTSQGGGTPPAAQAPPRAPAPAATPAR